MHSDDFCDDSLKDDDLSYNLVKMCKYVKNKMMHSDDDEKLLYVAAFLIGKRKNDLKLLEYFD